MQTKILQLPKIGLGTWMMSNSQAAKIIPKSLKIGYRFIDTAQMYKNEEGVGTGIKFSGYDRKEIILATKIWITNFSPEKIRKSVENSLKKLQTKYIDLLYLHWPAKLFYKPLKIFPVLAQMVSEGIVRFLGVSNFNIQLTEEAIQILDALHLRLKANQIELHPLLPQKSIRLYLQTKGIECIAYSPLLRAHLNEVPQLSLIAQKYHTSSAQITLAWEIAHNVIPIPKSLNENHLISNFQSQYLQLNPEDITMIDNIGKTKRFINPPFLSPKWDK